MKEYANKIFSIINNVHLFKIITLIINLIYAVPSSFDIENVPMKIVFVWGIYLLAKDFLTRRIMFKQKFWPFLFAFLISFAISVLLNLTYQFPDSAINWFYVAQTFFLIYAFNPSEDYQTSKKWMARFNDIFIGIVCFLGFVSLLLFAFHIRYWVLDGTGINWMRQGFTENRLFGLYTSPNMGSIIGVLSVVASLMNNILKRSSWKSFQPFYVFNAIIQYLYFVLASSRGTTLTLLTAGLVITCYAIYRLFVRHQDNFKSLGKVILGAGLGLFLFVAVEHQAESILAYIPATTQTAARLVTGQISWSDLRHGESKTGGNKSTVIAPVSIQHDEGDAEVSAGRFTIWQAGIKAAAQNFLFGLSDIDLYRNIKDQEATSQVDMTKLTTLDRSEIKRARGNMHNTYIAVFTKAGFVGLIIIAAFALFYLIYHVGYLMTAKVDFSDANNQIYALILVTIIALLAEDMVENHILLANRDTIGLIFWTYAGFLNVHRSQLQAQKSQAINKDLKSKFINIISPYWS